ncbi:MAG: hypothetical protein HY360_06955 [Verrucomicrobia bacterium]|nr:hypothetical protein [Verrucomicrobiota bacterium]
MCKVVLLPITNSLGNEEWIIDDTYLTGKTPAAQDVRVDSPIWNCPKNPSQVVTGRYTGDRLMRRMRRSLTSRRTAT